MILDTCLHSDQKLIACMVASSLECALPNLLQGVYIHTMVPEFISPKVHSCMFRPFGNIHKINIIHLWWHSFVSAVIGVLLLMMSSWGGAGPAPYHWDATADEHVGHLKGTWAEKQRKREGKPPPCPPDTTVIQRTAVIIENALIRSHASVMENWHVQVGGTEWEGTMSQHTLAQSGTLVLPQTPPPEPYKNIPIWAGVAHPRSGKAGVVR